MCSGTTQALGEDTAYGSPSGEIEVTPRRSG
jgi:hypothetical protein